MKHPMHERAPRSAIALHGLCRTYAARTPESCAAGIHDGTEAAAHPCRPCRRIRSKSPFPPHHQMAPFFLLFIASGNVPYSFSTRLLSEQPEPCKRASPAAIPHTSNDEWIMPGGAESGSRQPIHGKRTDESIYLRRSCIRGNRENNEKEIGEQVEGSHVFPWRNSLVFCSLLCPSKMMLFGKNAKSENPESFLVQWSNSPPPFMPIRMSGYRHSRS